jgi:hypothetical protein
MFVLVCLMPLRELNVGTTMFNSIMECFVKMKADLQTN